MPSSEAAHCTEYDLSRNWAQVVLQVLLQDPFFSELVLMNLLTDKNCHASFGNDSKAFSACRPSESGRVKVN